MRRAVATVLLIVPATVAGGCAAMFSRLEISDGTIPDNPRWAVPVYTGMQLDVQAVPKASDAFKRGWLDRHREYRPPTSATSRPSIG